jgi:hypothetical protein
MTHCACACVCVCVCARAGENDSEKLWFQLLDKFLKEEVSPTAPPSR